VTADELVRELASAPPSAVAFDGDGTLWSGDVGEDFFFALLESGDIREEATHELRRAAEGAGLDPRGSGAEIARRLYDAYLSGTYREERICEVMTWSFAGRSTLAARDFAAGVLGDRFAQSRAHPEALAVLQQAAGLGYRTYVVSASPRAVVELAAAALGVPADRVLAATPRLRGGHILPDVERPIPYGPGKAEALAAALGGGTLEAAFGDNAFDTDMLCAARRPVAVRPKQRLVERAAQVPALRQLTLEDRPPGALPSPI